MKKITFIVLCFAIFLPTRPAKGDFWGGDLPLLAEIVFNTLRTLRELEMQTSLLKDEMAGIKDRIERVRTIADLVQPSKWEEWKDPVEALARLRKIYYTMPREYRSEKSDAIEQEISKAMNTISKIGAEAQTTFQSGKELERRGADASPGVAQKLTASGVGSLVALTAQSQVLQSHITSLLTQMLADSNEREARSLVSKGEGYSSFSKILSQEKHTFSDRATAIGGVR